MSTTGTPQAAILLPSHTPPVDRHPMLSPQFAAAFLDQPEQLGRSLVDRLGRTAEAAMNSDLDLALFADSRDRLVEQFLRPGLVLGRFGPHV